MTGRIYNTQRYDDMIGFLVAFEKRAKKMEVCCDLETHGVNSNDSTSSFVSVNPSIVRKSDSTKAYPRGRLRTPVQEVIELEGSKKDTGIDGCFVAFKSDLKFIDDESFICDTINSDSSNKEFNTDHKIFAALEVVEVIMNNEDSHPFSELKATAKQVGEVTECIFDDFQKRPQQHRSFISTLAIDLNGSKCDITAVDALEVITVSSSSSFMIGAPPELQPYDSGSFDRKCQEFQLDDADLAVDSEGTNEASILRASNIASRIKEENGILRETKTNQVIFRDPIHEVIPMKHDLYTPSKYTSYAVGDHVEIMEGIYKHKVGRVVKITGDLVQVEVGVGFFMSLYISPSMLQQRNGCSLLA
jgi:hypothetical protein